jgi:hypothetical protein
LIWSPYRGRQLALAMLDLVQPVALVLQLRLQVLAARSAAEQGKHGHQGKAAEQRQPAYSGGFDAHPAP